jgi:hypothetical protein
MVGVSNHLIPALNSLAQLNIDAVSAYQHAMDLLPSNELRHELGNCKVQHALHVQTLSILVKELGGTPPVWRPNPNGVFLKASSGFLSRLHAKGILAALKSGERLLSRRYRALLSQPLPDRMGSLLRGQVEEEHSHIVYLEHTLTEWVEAALNLLRPAI